MLIPNIITHQPHPARSLGRMSLHRAQVCQVPGQSSQLLFHVFIFFDKLASEVPGRSRSRRFIHH